MYQNLWAVDKVVPWRNSIILNAFIRKTEKINAYIGREKACMWQKIKIVYEDVQ